MDSCMDFAGCGADAGLWGALNMARSDRKDAETSNKRRENRGAARRSYSIRFADSEWNLIERAAARQGVPAGEFARSGVLATLNREQLLDAERGEDLDELVAEARQVMRETMDEGPS